MDDSGRKYMPNGDRDKQNIYFPPEMVEEIFEECCRRNEWYTARGERKRVYISDLIVEAWRIARGKIMATSTPDPNTGRCDSGYLDANDLARRVADEPINYH